MPVVIPSLNELKTRMVQEAIRLSGDETLGHDTHPANVILTSASGVLHGCYATMKRTLEASFPDRAVGATLEAHGRVWGLKRITGTRASGQVWVEKAVADSVIPSGTRYSSDTGEVFYVDTPVQVPSDTNGEVAVPLIQEAASSAGNLAPSTELSLVNSVAGLPRTARVLAPGFVGGSDLESDAAYRARLLHRIRTPGAAGSVEDYEAWALSQQEHNVPVQRAWVVPRSRGVGTVDVYIALEVPTIAGIPNRSQREQVASYIRSVAPVGADLRILSPAPVLIDITLRIVEYREDVPIRLIEQNIRQAVEHIFLLRTKPGASFFVSYLHQAVAGARGVVHYTILNPSSDRTVRAGELPVLGGLGIRF